MSEYHINVFCSDEDGAWIADIPDLPGCSALGKTPEALAEVTAAKAAWLGAARESGRTIPEPKYRPRHLWFVTKVGSQTGAPVRLALERSFRCGRDRT
ncbi:MAG: type II toxin-antitoxin system HicB family antitoxin [Actinomycetota bacterium]